MTTQEQISLVPGKPDHVHLPIEDEDWEARLADVRSARQLPPHALYLVYFFSKRRADITEAEVELLTTGDELAHEEALASTALIHYKQGLPNEVGEAENWCLWENMEEARRVVQGPAHQAATRFVRFYESYLVAGYNVHHAVGAVALEQLWVREY